MPSHSADLSKDDFVKLREFNFREVCFTQDRECIGLREFSVFSAVSAFPTLHQTSSLHTNPPNSSQRVNENFTVTDRRLLSCVVVTPVSPYRGLVSSYAPVEVMVLNFCV